MNNGEAEISHLVQRALAGDREALATLFDDYRQKLRRMVAVRLDERLSRRIDPSDVVQDAYVEVHKRLNEYVRTSMPFFLWLRFIVGQKLVDLHRYHLGAQKRSVVREVIPQTSSLLLAESLAGQLTPVSKALRRAEVEAVVHDALNAMQAIDCEVLSLRHFEQLSNAETACVLRITKNAASNRYVRAIRRLKEIIEALPGVRNSDAQF